MPGGTNYLLLINTYAAIQYIHSSRKKNNASQRLGTVQIFYFHIIYIAKYQTSKLHQYIFKKTDIYKHPNIDWYQ